MRLVRAIAPEPSDDHLWVAAVLAGDAGAFRVLFDRHAAAVRRFVRDLGRDEGLADEATQETFVRAHARLATLRDDQRMRPWLLGIARRVWLEEIRRRRPRAQLDAGTALRRRGCCCAAGARSPIGRGIAAATARRRWRTWRRRDARPRRTGTVR